MDITLRVRTTIIAAFPTQARCLLALYATFQRVYLELMDKQKVTNLGSRYLHLAKCEDDGV